MRLRSYFFDYLMRVVRTELPYCNDMDEYIDTMLPKIKRFSDSFKETGLYIDKRWLEVRDDDTFQEQILHIFKPELKPIELKTREDEQGSAYLRSIDGNVTKGIWRFISSNGIIIKHLNTFELYDLAFLNSDFLVLKKHGNQAGHGRKYMVLGNEGLIKGLEWREVMELLYDVHRYNVIFMMQFLAVIAAVLGLLLWSL